MATNTDIPAILSLWNTANLPIKPKGRDHPSSLKVQLKKDHLWIVVAEIAGEIVGTIVATHDGRKGWMNRLAVHPNYQHQGIALQLVLEAERILHEAGIEVYAALIESKNTPSRKLFEKAGYTFHDDIAYYSKRLSPDS